MPTAHKSAADTESATDTPVAQAPQLPFQRASELMWAYKAGRTFTLHYHGKRRTVTDMKAGIQCVWVCAGPMLPVHIRPDGTSKDGPNIWLTEN